MAITKYSYSSFARSTMLSCLIILAAGCTFTASYGLYEGSDCPGWVRYDLGDGGYSYRPPDRHNELSVLFGAVKKGQLYFRIHLGNKGAIIFLEDKIKINVTGHAEMQEIDAKDSSTLTVPLNEDFTVIIPSFKAGIDVLPELRVNFHWSDRKVYTTKKYLEVEESI